MQTGDQAQQTDPAERFALIGKWPERIGSAEWRKRAAKELSSTEHEAFLFYAGTLEGLNHPEHEAVSREWERFNAERAKTFRERTMMRSVVELVDGAAGAVSTFGVFGLVAWVVSPAMFDNPTTALWLYFHLSVMGVYGISLLARQLRRLRRCANAGEHVD